ncbi:glycosyltransferase family 25 protein [Shimia sp. MMG029]|uniref:glycosyltransferase family 25 protein n=1 Tax=Shimia sp. MMG029 TaxID=3021978 RepID=UPI0022FEBB8D|nr:glycosyltransferase family 25 protein [Shimia sp. MMG029]MDA5556789.1 glycosyltransferase family 25 protein [Shimia sp. MMG029]
MPQQQDEAPLAQVATWVINLETDAERLRVTGSLLQDADLPWSRFPAVDGRATNLKTHHLNNSKRQSHLFGRELNSGEIGCFLSHLHALEKFAAGSEEYLLILEDDADVPKSLARDVYEIIKWHEANPKHRLDCVNLCNASRKRNTPLAALSGRQLLRSWYFPVLTTACLWTKEGARAFVNQVHHGGIDGPLDDRMRAWFAKTGGGMHLDPVLVPPRQVASSIDAMGSRSTSTLPRSKQILRRKLPVYGWVFLNKLKSLFRAS